MERDELAKSLRAGFGAIIREADDWRPLADHVLSLLAAAEARVTDLERDCAAECDRLQSERDQCIAQCAEALAKWNEWETRARGAEVEVARLTAEMDRGAGGVLW